MLSDAFLSIVHKDCAENELLVRARRPGDIGKVFGNVKVSKDTHADYLFRARVPFEQVIVAIGKQIGNINYPNFKDTVTNDGLHNAYLQVWSAMAKLQDPPPYSGGRWMGTIDASARAESKKPPAASLKQRKKSKG